MMQKIVDWIAPYWKAVVALMIPLAFDLLVGLVEGLQGTFVDNVIVVAVLTSFGVWLKANRPATLS